MAEHLIQLDGTLEDINKAANEILARDKAWKKDRPDEYAKINARLDKLDMKYQDND